MLRFGLLLLLAGCRWRFGLMGDDVATPDPDGGFVVDDAGQFVSCQVDTDCGRCQRCANNFCQRATFVELDLGQKNACALDELGDVWCWGENGYLIVAAELDGTAVIPRPRRRTDIPDTIDRIGVGWGAMYLRTIEHHLLSRGTLDGNVSDTRTFWDKVSASHFNGCATTTGGAIYCAGQGDYGELGNGLSAGGQQPLTQFGAATDWASVATGNTTCAIKQDGTLWCVGYNTYGQLGRGTTSTFEVDIAQVGTAADWTAVVIGELHVCGARTGGTLWCWGLDRVTGLAVTAPTQVGASSGWSNLDTYYRCATAVRGGVPYWTCRDATELASSLQGITSFDWAPMPITPDPGTGVALGAMAGCFRQNGAWMCWGDNRKGAVGVDELAVVGPTALCE